MQLTLEKKHESRIEFFVDGISTSFANTIRRYSMTRVPVLAMDRITFYDNTSSLWDEYIAHRLGLMPIVTPEHMPKNAEVIFSLDEHGPKVVYAKDMKSSDAEIKVAKDDLIVITLGAGQHLRFESRAKLGTGEEHAKFQAGLVSYGIENGKTKFIVESFHQMPPQRVLMEGIDTVLSDLDDIESFLSGKKKDKTHKE